MLSSYFKSISKLFYRRPLKVLLLLFVSLSSPTKAKDHEIVFLNSEGVSWIYESEETVELNIKVDDVIGLVIENERTEFKVVEISQDPSSISIEAINSNGNVLLWSQDSNSVYGSFSDGASQYTLRGTPSAKLTLTNNSDPDFPKSNLGEDAFIPPNKNRNIPGIEQLDSSSRAKLKRLNQSSAKTGVSTVRMLFVYSQEFANGFASPENRIAQLVAFTNSAFSRSGVQIELEIAHTQLVPFSNGNSDSSLITQVTNGSGAFTSVEALRDTHFADMVAVLAFNTSSFSSGVAWLNGDDPDFAYSVTRLSRFCCDSVFAHEIGHNLGSGHERASVNDISDPCDEFNFTGYSCGHGNKANGWGTIMSRLDSENVGEVFSNPGLNCLGEPCGIAEGIVGAADNFSSFNQSRLLVANFKPDPPTDDGTDDPAPTNPNSSDPNGANKDSVVPIISILLDDD